jgi:hypothetical protein
MLEIQVHVNLPPAAETVVTSQKAGRRGADEARALAVVIVNHQNLASQLWAHVHALLYNHHLFPCRIQSTANPTATNNHPTKLHPLRRARQLSNPTQTQTTTTTPLLSTMGLMWTKNWGGRHGGMSCHSLYSPSQKLELMQHNRRWYRRRQARRAPTALPLLVRPLLLLPLDGDGLR